MFLLLTMAAISSASEGWDGRIGGVTHKEWASDSYVVKERAESVATLPRSFPKIAHAHNCPPIDPPVPKQIGGSWIFNNLLSPHDGMNRYFTWYVMNSSRGCSQCADISQMGKIGTTLREKHYLLGPNGFPTHPGGFISDMSLGDQIWVLWSLAPSADGYKAICSAASEWMAIDSDKVFFIQRAVMNEAHPDGIPGSAWSTTADFVLPIPNDVSLIGLRVYEQVWFRDMSEIGTDQEWAHAGHGDMWQIF